MEAPLGITFFKEVEIYQFIKDQQQKAKSEDEGAGGTPPIWPIAAKILLWTRKGHKHPLSTISENRLYPWHKDNKLKDFDLSESDLYRTTTQEKNRKKETVTTVNQVLKYLTFFDFAKLKKLTDNPKEEDEGRTQIVFTNKGFLAGKVLDEMISGNLFVKRSYSLWGLLWGHYGASLLFIILFASVFWKLFQFVKYLIKFS